MNCEVLDVSFYLLVYKELKSNKVIPRAPPFSSSLVLPRSPKGSRVQGSLLGY